MIRSRQERLRQGDREMGKQREIPCCDRYNLQLAFIVKHLASIAESMAIQCMPERMRWHPVSESVPPEGVDVLLYEDVCSGEPVVIGRRDGNTYRRTGDTEYIVKPMYWMHIPLNKYVWVA